MQLNISSGFTGSSAYTSFRDQWSSSLPIWKHLYFILTCGCKWQYSTEKMADLGRSLLRLFSASGYIWPTLITIQLCFQPYDYQPTSLKNGLFWIQVPIKPLCLHHAMSEKEVLLGCKCMTNIHTALHEGKAMSDLPGNKFTYKSVTN